MAIVAGVDFGTLSVRVAIVDSERGRLGSAIAEYPLHRTKDDPDHATQSHADHMRALIESMQLALQAANVSGDQIASIALDTTGSSVLPVGEGLEPLDDYYLWCDHRAWREAALITETAHKRNQKLKTRESLLRTAFVETCATMSTSVCYRIAMLGEQYETCCSICQFENRIKHRR